VSASLIMAQRPPRWAKGLTGRVALLVAQPTLCFEHHVTPEGAALRACVILTVHFSLISSEPTALLFTGLIACFWLIGEIEWRRYAPSLRSIEFSWAEPHYTCVRQGRVEASLSVRNPSELWLYDLALTLKGREGESDPLVISLAPHAEALIPVTLEGREIGLTLLWGVTLRWRAPLSTQRFVVSQPLPLSLYVNARRTGRPLNTRAHPLYADEGRGRRQRSDEGDFQELRPYQAGDERRRVAWRASARRGALLSKVYEEPSQRRLLIAVDVGPTMRLRDGEGIRALDEALDFVAQNLRPSPDLEVGLVLFAQSVMGALAPCTRKGADNLQALLYSATTLAHEELTEADDELITLTLGEQLYALGCAEARRLGEGFVKVSPPDPRLGSEYDVAYITMLAQRYLNPLARSMPKGFSLPSPHLERGSTYLRALCQQLSLSLPPRRAAPWGSSEGAFNAITQHAQQWRCGELMVVSHAERLDRSQDLMPLIKWARKSGALTWVEVRSPSVPSEPDQTQASGLPLLPPLTLNQTELLRPLARCADLRSITPSPPPQPLTALNQPPARLGLLQGEP
jgi:uncharacterized protein (DUF58 family)